MKTLLFLGILLASTSSFAQTYSDQALCKMGQNSIFAGYSAQTKLVTTTWVISGKTTTVPGAGYALLNKQQTLKEEYLAFVAQNVGININTVDFTKVFILDKNHEGSANLINFIQKATNKSVLVYVALSSVIKCN